MGGTTREIHYVSGGNGLCAMIVRENGVNNIYFVYTDHLGSLVAFTNNTGAIVAEQNFDAWGRSRNPATWQYTAGASTPTWLYRGYTGHELAPHFALINMNGRMYDPIQGRMLSPDNYVSTPFGTQGYNRYTYALNNPLMYTDPDGNNPLLIAAIIGGVLNLGINPLQGNIHSFGDGLKYFGIGAFSGALGAGVAGGVSASIVGGSFSGGFLGTSGAAATGFFSGALSGAVGGVASGFTSGLGNSLAQGNSLLSALTSGAKSSLIGGIGGGIVGGISGGIDALSNDVNFFTGTTTVNMSGGVGAHNISSDALNSDLSVRYVGRFENTGISVYEPTSYTSGFGSGQSSGGITLPGFGIVVGKEAFVRMGVHNTWNLVAHEFGHVLQSKLPYVGADGFYGVIGPESLMSASINPAGHSNYWTETWANHLSHNYFGARPWNFAGYPVKNISIPNMFKFFGWRTAYPIPVPAIYP